MVKLNKKSIEKILRKVNSEEFKSKKILEEDLFGEFESIETLWEDVIFQSEELLNEVSLMKSIDRKAVYSYKKTWKAINVNGSNGSCYLKQYLHDKAMKTDHVDISKIPYKPIIEEALYRIDKFEIEDSNLMNTTRYSKYIFPNGTLYVDKIGDWEFKEGWFDPADKIREEENPMFPFDFVESSDGVENLYKVFNEWSICGKTLVRFITYCIFQKMDFENVMLYLLGKGSNGKSMLIKLIKALFPSDAATFFNVSKMTLDKDGSEALEHSYINISGEVKFTDFDMTTLKNITGGDEISVNVKNKTPVHFTSTAKIVVSANEAPRLLHTKHGDLRRFIIMDFNKTFPRVTKYFETELQPYIQALFFECLILAKDVRENGIGFSDEMVENTQNKIREESDTVYNFINQFSITIDTNANNGLGYDERSIYKKYVEWCKFEGKKSYSNKRFYDQMDDLLNAKTRVSGHKYNRWLNVRPLNQDWIEYKKIIEGRADG